MTSALTPRLALLLTLPPLLWAGNAVVGRLAVGHIGPLWLNAARWALAFALILPLGWRAFATPAARSAIRQRWRHLALLSAVGVGAYNALQYLALTTSTPMNVTLIAASSPVWAMAIGALAYGIPPRPSQLAGAALSLLGVAVVMGRGDLATLLAVKLVPGDLLMLLAIISWSAYSWLLAKPPPHMQGAARQRGQIDLLDAQALVRLADGKAQAVHHVGNPLRMHLGRMHRQLGGEEIRRILLEQAGVRPEEEHGAVGDPLHVVAEALVAHQVGGGGVERGECVQQPLLAAPSKRVVPHKHEPHHQPHRHRRHQRRRLRRPLWSQPLSEPDHRRNSVHACRHAVELRWHVHRLRRRQPRRARVV